MLTTKIADCLIRTHGSSGVGSFVNCATTAAQIKGKPYLAIATNCKSFTLKLN